MSSNGLRQADDDDDGQHAHATQETQVCCRPLTPTTPTSPLRIQWMG